MLSMNQIKKTLLSVLNMEDIIAEHVKISCFGAANELNLEINLNSAPRNERDSVVDGAEVLTPSNGGCIGVRDSANDQSLPEIVMEQEELSDPEEEIEDVEFEREEMTDSEGEDEEPYSHQILNTQNKFWGIKQLDLELLFEIILGLLWWHLNSRIFLISLRC